MNKTLFIIILLAPVVLVAFVVLLPIPFSSQKQATVTNFEECLLAGNLAMESHPRRCRTTDGQLFIEVIDDNGGTGILPFDSGVQGKVLLGPICPVLSVDKDGKVDDSCADKPYKGTVQVVALGQVQSSPFATATINELGEYKVILPPGNYSLQAVGGVPFPRCEWQEITVEPSTMLEIDLLCDTGIR